jgi:hypothetical protein
MREIKTVAEIAALPVGAVVVDGDRDAWQKHRIQNADEAASTVWWCTVSEHESPDEFLLDYAPLQLIWTPEGGDES